MIKGQDRWHEFLRNVGASPGIGSGHPQVQQDWEPEVRQPDYTPYEPPPMNWGGPVPLPDLYRRRQWQR